VEPILLADIVDRHDRRVAQVGGGDRLALEALDELGVEAQLWGEHLERDPTTKLRIVGLIDPRHPAAADRIFHLIAAKLSPAELGHNRFIPVYLLPTLVAELWKFATVMV
jgi:hypothetical protein